MLRQHHDGDETIPLTTRRTRNFAASQHVQSQETTGRSRIVVYAVILIVVIAAVAIALSVTLTDDGKDDEQPAGVPQAVLKTSIPQLLQCHSKTIDRLSVTADSMPVIPEGFRLVQATAHSRHTDRWMYRHDLINNVCWTNQLNSTEPKMKDECDYTQSTVWQNYSFTQDPYALPVAGHCNEKQLTVQGTMNAYRLGQAYRTQFETTSGYSFEPSSSPCSGSQSSSIPIPELCQPGKIKLETSETTQKNTRSLQEIYMGLCDKEPSIAEFPADQVMYNGTRTNGNPFFLLKSVCESSWLQQAMVEAGDAWWQSRYIAPMQSVVAKVANATGHSKIIDDTRSHPFFLDNIWDCMVSHSCHDLTDTPTLLWDVAYEMDFLETASRLYVLQYWEQREAAEYDRFVSLYYGYYFVTVLERMREAISQPDVAPLLYVQVTSDSIVSPMLYILEGDATRRPVWGSQVIYQLLQKEADGTYHVRILHDGNLLRMESLDDFAAWVGRITPPTEECTNFYDNFP